MSVLGSIASAVGAAGQIFGIGQGRQDKRQVRQQEKLNYKTEESNKRMMDYNQMKQFEMWQKTNYGGQKAEMEKAGLNPGLMYGMSGGGGVTTGGGAPSVGGGQAANAAQTTQANAAMGMSLAQMKLIEAQTENVKADTASKQTEPALKEAQTGEIISRTEINKLEAELRDKSMEDQLTIIEYTGEKLLGERDEAWARGNVAQATQVQEIKLINQELANKAIEAVAMKSGIELNKARIDEIVQGIQQKWEELSIRDTQSRWEHNDRIVAIREYTKTALQTAGIHAAGNIVSDVVGIATRKMPKGKTTIEEKKTDKGWERKYKEETNQY